MGSSWSLCDRYFACDLPGCCNDCSANFPCTRRCICVTTIALFIVGIIVAIIALVVTVGIPPHTPVNRLCLTTSNQTGFLCDDRETCIPVSQVCDTRRNCVNGEDEQKTLCSNVPSSLPGYMIFYCGNRRFWIYADKRCNGFNDCGDCSDEIGACKSILLPFELDELIPGLAALLVSQNDGDASQSSITIVTAFPEAFAEMEYRTAKTGLMNIYVKDE
ncbi:hypothetical protein lerEdw1_011689 [Lerista edwardsae]|nr:hypothetical protein lerEdw1_011689 [Lerista edwardsae]